MTPVHKRAHIDESLRASIKKECDVGFPFSGYSQSVVEEERSIEVDDLNNYSKYLSYFLEYLDRGPSDFFIPEYTLSPDAINGLFQLSKQFENHSNYSIKTSTFFNSCIQKSYENGFNGFYLHTEGHKLINRLLSDLKAVKENPMEVKIFGGLGSMGLSETKYLDVEVDGDVDQFFGIYSKNLRALVNGSARGWCGIDSTDATILLDDVLESECGLRSENFSLYARGDVESMAFKMTNPYFIIDGDFLGEKLYAQLRKIDYDRNDPRWKKIEECMRIFK